MADTLSTQDLAELKQLYKDLQNIQIPDMDGFIRALGGVEAARKNLVQMRKEFANINSDVSYFAESLAKVLQEIKGQNSALGKTKSAYSSLSSIASKLKYDQDGISRLSEKELKTNIDLNVKISMQMLRKWYSMHGDWTLACGAYNSGQPIRNEYAQYAASNKDYKNKWTKL